jgi:hypothetical protein
MRHSSFSTRFGTPPTILVFDTQRECERFRREAEHDDKKLDERLVRWLEADISYAQGLPPRHRRPAWAEGEVMTELLSLVAILGIGGICLLGLSRLLWRRQHPAAAAAEAAEAATKALAELKDEHISAIVIEAVAELQTTLNEFRIRRLKR